MQSRNTLVSAARAAQEPFIKPRGYCGAPDSRTGTLQLAIDHSPRILSQRRALHSMLGPAFNGQGGRSQPLQLRLDHERLNVVGETHNKSDEDRLAEMKFVKQKTGGFYRTETSFLIRVKNKLVTADPRILRFLAALELLYAREFKKDSIKEFTRSVAAHNALLKRAQDNYDAFLAEGSEYGMNYVNELEISIPTVYESFRKMADRINSLSPDFARLTESQVTNIKASQAEIRENLKSTGPRQINSTRSNHMRLIGNALVAQKGAYMVGERHVQDIKEQKENGRETKFNLVTEEDFLGEFRENGKTVESSSTGSTSPMPKAEQKEDAPSETGSSSSTD